MKKTLLLSCLLSCISVFTQNVNISFPNYYNFTDGLYNASDFDMIVYLDPTESVAINSSFGSNTSFDIYKANYTPGVTAADIYANQATYNFTLYQNILPCDYTFQTGFSDFVYFIMYNNYFQLNEMYKVLVINNEALTASITENSISSFKLYPNPANNDLKISSDLSNIDYQILDLNGRILMEAKGDKIDISHLQSGQYFIKGETLVQKFIKE